ncbi:MAG: acetylxylan esterase [Actinomycetota bacterium]
MLVDLPMEELWKYKPEQNREADFDSFWQKTIKQAESQPLNADAEKLSYIVSEIDAYKIYYHGFEKSRICGFYLLPKGSGTHPAILWFHGYGDNKQDIGFYLKWVLMGYAVLAVDIKGQNGESVDKSTYPPPSVPGFMARGVFDKHRYYYRGVYMDCLKALDFLESRPEIDSSRLCVTGGSQGGGLPLEVACAGPQAQVGYS